eukprot:scaffold90448_cov17-Tisochrysis_lutea.AAC.2
MLTGQNTKGLRPRGLRPKNKELERFRGKVEKPMSPRHCSLRLALHQPLFDALQTIRVQPSGAPLAPPLASSSQCSHHHQKCVPTIVNALPRRRNIPIHPTSSQHCTRAL